MASYKKALKMYAPDYWDKSDDKQVELHSDSEEFLQVAFEVRHALLQGHFIKRIVRVQMWHDLGQFLIRGQLLVVANPQTQYYQARMYIKIKKTFVENALKYNLDHRRCGLKELVFWNTMNPNPTMFLSDDVLVAVQVVTSQPNLPVRPNNNLEYFIDYLVYF